MRRVILAIVSTAAALVMILSFKTHGTSSLATPPAAVATTGSATSGTASASSPSRSSSRATSTGTRTVTGTAVATRYGPVQVKVTVTNGRIASVTAIEYPQNDPRDEQINAYAIPALNQEAKQAGTAAISMISGATYTSQGYIQSLQSALDQVK